MKSSRQTAKDLVALAADARTPEKERLAAALKAVMLIQRDDLLSSPLDGIAEIDNETVQSVSKIMNVVMDPDFTKSVKKVWGSVGRGKKRR